MNWLNKLDDVIDRISEDKKAMEVRQSREEAKRIQLEEEEQNEESFEEDDSEREGETTTTSQVEGIEDASRDVSLVESTTLNKLELDTNSTISEEPPAPLPLHESIEGGLVDVSLSSHHEPPITRAAVPSQQENDELPVIDTDLPTVDDNDTDYSTPLSNLSDSAQNPLHDGLSRIRSKIASNLAPLEDSNTLVASQQPAPDSSKLERRQIEQPPPFEQSTGDVTTEQPDETLTQSPSSPVASPRPPIHHVPDELQPREPADGIQNQPLDSQGMPETPRRSVVEATKHVDPVSPMRSPPTPETPASWKSRREDSRKTTPPSNIELPSFTRVQLEKDLADFNVQLPLTPWIDPEAGTFDASLNCLGVVHVRVMAAQQLPCPLGSSVQAIVALPPWKGRIRSEKTTAVGAGPAGVCVKWDQLDNDANVCSMVHQWNSADTPVPSISVDLVFKPIQMLEFSMCTLQLSCEPLMCLPGVWKRQWCRAEISKSLKDSDASIAEHNPLILLEAAFIPAEQEDDMADESEGFVDHSSISSRKTLDVPESPRRSRTSGGGTIGSHSTYQLTAQSRPHLLRVQSFWVPTHCAVCSASIMGWKRGYRCEVCSIDCCDDCQLQIDLQIPCGSSAAKKAVEKSLHRRLTVGKMLATVAPVNEEYEQSQHQTRARQADSAKSDILPGSNQFDIVDSDKEPSPSGIGTLRVKIQKACLFAYALSADTEPRDVFDATSNRPLRVGDHYIRISPKGETSTTRTRTIQNSGKPLFDSDEMVFEVPHYGMEYKIEVVDAATDKPVGTALLTTQALLQQQRDELVAANGISAFVPVFGQTVTGRKRQVLLELRTGVKSGYSSDYFVSSTSPSRTKAGRAHPGDICGWVDVVICIEEDLPRLFSRKNPIECPQRPANDLNMDMFQLHMGRVSALLADIYKGFLGYLYIISWKNPLLTGSSLVLFVCTTLRFNAEYVGSIPPFLIICYMLYIGWLRGRGYPKNRFVDRERAAKAKTEKEVAVSYSLHRPLGRLEIDIRRGKNLCTRELGLPGSVGCRVYWDPTRYARDDKSRESSIAIDKALIAPHDIGETNNVYKKNPVWTNATESAEAKRLRQLLPKEGSFFTLEMDEDGAEGSSEPHLEFPMLQPVKAAQVSEESNIGDKKEKQGAQSRVELDLWSNMVGSIVVQVRFQDVINRLPGFGDVLGEVALPVAKIIENGEIKGWFQVLDVGTTRSLPVSGSEEKGPFENESPLIFLHVRWEKPKQDAEVTDTDREGSIVVAQEQVRSAVKASESKFDIIGSSMGAFNKVRGLGGNVQTVQNTLGGILDLVESLRNAFNFTDPYKSSIVLALVVVVWLFFVFVSTRAVVLIVGLAQYIGMFVSTFLSSSNRLNDENDELDPVKVHEEVKGNPLVLWAKNALRGIPTDEDLRKTYFWESRRVGERESAKVATEKRIARLQRLWKAQWFATVSVRVQEKRRSSITSGTESTRDWYWQEVFAVVHGRRLLWWQSSRDFDEGEPPIGYIFLAGHAGLAGLSPLDIRELDKEEEVPLVVSIFGRGKEGQQKLMLLTTSVESKEELETAILAASTKGD